MGFKNNWANIQIGNGREGWGAGNDIQLALAKIANPIITFC